MDERKEHIFKACYLPSSDLILDLQYSFIQSINQYLLNASKVPGFFQVTRDTEMNKTVYLIFMAT